ncbi:hypothetical protein T265_04710 [Opisthorchis viverrini]|uniref:SHSP domain-containing protein n=1 Tax=Opisthorchis viverrini TaxID=6198 RepID=A0A074ZMX5_OPIVI|nr:hypothetical protein T265_04710 [Opisthorchis viverrini]KER28486.1 hypothetical protein T265_04710 [Opisthorchis viverrini]
MKVFEMSVADRLLDDSNKLIYLLHYCCDEAKEAIAHCVFLIGKIGYQRAMVILKTQFGKPHDIAQSFMNELLTGGPIAPGDVDALRRLIRKMVNCDLALRQMHYMADLNCSTNLKRIVGRLPWRLQEKWAEAADDILRSGSEPEFDHLVSFLNRIQITGVLRPTVLRDDKSGGEKLHVEIPAYPEFTADDLCVRMDENRVVVSVKWKTMAKTDNSSSTFIKEFSRLYGMPRTVDTFSVIPQLQGDKLLVEAPLLRPCTSR